jgi:hypothetical protein
VGFFAALLSSHLAVVRWGVPSTAGFCFASFLSPFIGFLLDYMLKPEEDFLSLFLLLLIIAANSHFHNRHMTCFFKCFK